MASKNCETRRAKWKAYSLETAREKNKAAYRPWTDELDEELTVMYCEGIAVGEIAKRLERTKGSIISRVKKLEWKNFMVNIFNNSENFYKATNI